jgi:hypothetical protein
VEVHFAPLELFLRSINIDLSDTENSDDPAFQKENINRLTRDVEANLTDINAVARGLYLNLIAPAADKSLTRSAAP